MIESEFTFQIYSKSLALTTFEIMISEILTSVASIDRLASEIHLPLH